MQEKNFIGVLSRLVERRPWVVSILLAALAIYPQLVSIPMEWRMYQECGKPLHYFATTPIRFLLFFCASLLCLLVNFRYLRKGTFWNVCKWDFVMCILVAPIFWIIVKVFHLKSFMFYMIYFELLILWIFVTGLSYLDILTKRQLHAEKEKERLEMESMKSRYEALVGQVNPHFFFNSLNGLSSLVRKRDENATLQYIEEISDIFRYTLQREPMSLVPLENEIEFAKQYLSVLKTRYASKFSCRIDVPEGLDDVKLPPLTMLPILENIPTHNRIDSEHRMEVTLSIKGDCLEVANLKYPKVAPPSTAGTGLANLSSRFEILCGKQIEIVQDETRFTVRLPLIREDKTETRKDTI